MAVDSNMTGVQASASRAPAAPPSHASDAPRSPLIPAVLEALTAEVPRFVACAPGRLDLIGGSAEYTGSLIVNMPTARHVCVGVQPRTDGMLRVVTTVGSADEEPLSIPLTDLTPDDSGSVDESKIRSSFHGVRSDAVRCALAAIVEMMCERLIPVPGGGLSVAIGSDVHSLSDAGAASAVVAATLVAATGAFDILPDPLTSVVLAQRVENKWLDSPVGIGDAMCSLHGRPNALMRVRSDSGLRDDPIGLSGGFTVIGLDSGVKHGDALQKYARVRSASFMGQALIGRIIQHDGGGHTNWNGHLSRISIADYVERFRDRIPTSLKGTEFLDRFGETGDPLTEVEPSFAYKVRSRTEHHVYENARACQFVECLARAIRRGGTEALAEAGELMYASHWSYGQRCGLGSVETDLLVSRIRRLGLDHDIFGAKISGRGCGGVIAVLMKPTERARDAIASIQRDYEAKTGRPCEVVRGFSPGAMVAGCQRL